MRVTVSTLNDAIFNLDVSEDLELENFKALCAVESDVPTAEIIIVLNGRPLIGEQKSLKDHGVSDGDVVVMQHHRTTTAPPGGRGRAGNPANTSAGGFPNFDFSGIHVPGRSSGGTPRARHNPAPVVDQDDPAVIRDQLLASPEQLALLKQNNPALSDALHSGDFEKFSKMIRDMQVSHREREAQRHRLLTADSMDVEAQRLIEDEIRQKQVDANMEAAMEYNPESFGTVCMLYINCRVNGVPVKAFIDSGAQTTIMSTDCAERCKIMRLVDTRFSGIAKGVGTQKIIGRIHMVQIQIANDFFVSSFSILEDQKMDMLLGLDLLRRHQCVIDLKRNCLVIGTTATEAPFLPESELPESARLSNNHHKSDSFREHESAAESLGSEDAGLAHAIEQSVKDQQQAKAGPSSSGGETDPNTAAVTISSEDKFTEKDVQDVLKLGYPRAQVMFELRRFNGDKTQAMAALIAKSFPFMKLP